MSWFGSFAVSRLLSGHSRPARTNVKHANDARCACSCNKICSYNKKHTKKAKKRKIHNQLPLFTSTPPPSLHSTKSCSLKKEKVCRLFPFSSSLEDRRARILKKKKRKNGKMSSSDCQIRTDNVFFFFHIHILRC